MKHLISILGIITMMILSPITSDAKFITDETIESAIRLLSSQHTEYDKNLIVRGVKQTASLWIEQDGSQEEFIRFIQTNFITDDSAKNDLFNKLCTAFETLKGTSNQVAVDLSLPTILAGPDPTEVDYIFSAFNPYSHLWNDLFENKIAFITILNFPNYTLEEKNRLGHNWSRIDWAYARMGDMFTSRVPAEINKEAAQATANSSNYIASYNIMMGNILNNNGDKLFPTDMILLSHWNLRDEIKSNYVSIPNANEKQEIIYKILCHIISGTIPQDVINNTEYDWNPITNETFKSGKQITLANEDSRRYEHILEHFKTMLKTDPYQPQQPTGIVRNFEGSMEMMPQEVEDMFINLISSPQVKQVAQIIQQKLGRKLRPYDIWYDGFKSRSAISEDELTALTRQKYPNPQAFEDDMPRMLCQLGFTPEDAQFLASKIKVEGARGSGHAWGAVGRWEKSLLRTRIAPTGMDYKGYNIAVHEFGHNVEQTIDLYNIDHYTMAGVPNTGFTEALAFIFQKRDLQLLGFDHKMDDNTTLDIFWGLYEIMGVSLVDMKMWQWLYENPDATASQLKDATIKIAHDVWNKYYYPILGEKDSPILACYSHMVDAPMYLPNYPLGHIIEFQLEEHFAKYNDPRQFTNEIMRIYRLGRLTPNHWMFQAVGSKPSTTPILNAVSEILK